MLIHVNNSPFLISDPRFVNNSELSDVQFLIDGKLFYAHRIILVNASNRFRAMLSKKFSEGNQSCIELNDVTYKIFEVGILVYSFTVNQYKLG